MLLLSPDAVSKEKKRCYRTFWPRPPKWPDQRAFLEIGFDHENNRKYVKYTPRVTKNVQGLLKHRRVEINPIIQYEDRSNPRCLVLLYEKYLSMIPRTGPLYRKSLETVASYGPKFGANAIPVNQMSQIFKRFYGEAGIDTTGRNISKHSGRVTCCTRLYNEGFTDKAVISRSNHQILD
jgi:integrase